MRLLLSLMLVAGLLVAAFWLAQRPGARGGHAPAVTPHAIPKAPLEDDSPVEHRAPVAAPAPEVGPTSVPASDGFPRSALAGTVVWSDGTPAGGIGLEIRSAAQRETARALAAPSSNEKGEFAAVVPGTGPFVVRAFAESGGGTRVEGVLRPVEAGATNLWMRLPRTACLQGRVHDDEGSPVEEFTLLLRRRESPGAPPVRATFRQSDGSFETQALECREWVGTVTASGFGPTELTSISLPRDRPLEVRMVRTSRVQGVVRDALGSPAEGVRVGVLGLESTTTSGPDGAFELECRCGTAVVGVLDPTRATGPPLTLELQPGELRTGLVLRVVVTGTVLGRVLTLGARPAAGRDVVLVPGHVPPVFPARSEVTLCVTDRDGAFHAPLAPGQWEARVELTRQELEALQQTAESRAESVHPYMAETFSVAAHENAQISILLGPAPVHLRGTLTKAGEPSTGGTLTAVDVQTGLLTEAQVAGSTYSLALARAGPCLFTLTFGRTTRKLLLDVPAEGSSAYDLDLPIGWIEGRVRTRAGEPVPDAKVVASASLTQRAGGCAFAHTEPDGTFSIEAAPGEYGVSTGEPGEQMNPWAWGLITGIQLEAGVRLTGLELVTLADDVFPTLEVELKEPSGALVRGGYVRLREASRPDAFVFLDAPEGNATFHRLSGEYRVECEAPGHRQMEERSVRLNRGPPERIEVVLTPVHEVLVTLAAGPPPGPSDLDAVDTTGRVFPALRVAPEDEPAGANEGERLFRFAAVPEGSVLLRAFAGPSVEEYRVDVPPGARDPFRIELGGE